MWGYLLSWKHSQCVQVSKCEKKKRTRRSHRKMWTHTLNKRSFVLNNKIHWGVNLWVLSSLTLLITACIYVHSSHAALTLFCMWLFMFGTVEAKTSLWAIWLSVGSANSWLRNSIRAGHILSAHPAWIPAWAYSLWQPRCQAWQRLCQRNTGFLKNIRSV